MYFLIKIITSALIIALVSELAKKYTSLAGFIAAMPITSLIIICWLYFEKRDLTLLANFSTAIFWGIFPSFAFFIVAILLFRQGVNFFLTLFLSSLALGVGFLIHQKLIPN